MKIRCRNARLYDIVDFLAMWFGASTTLASVPEAEIQRVYGNFFERRV